jgi:hypothetical protein
LALDRLIDLLSEDADSTAAQCVERAEVSMQGDAGDQKDDTEGQP